MFILERVTINVANDNDSNIILETKNLTRKVSHNNSYKKIIDDFSFSFERCKVYTIIGPSGAGKSSLLRLLNRLDEPSEGQVFFEGEDYKLISPCELRKKIGFLFQTPHLFEGTVKDNLRYIDQTLSDEYIEKIANQAHIKPDLIESDASLLSVGEKQRVALARMLTLNPEIILLDEPTSALDPSYTKAIENLIKEIVDNCKSTVIFVSHNPEQALRMGGEGLLMVNGRLIESGAIEQLVNNPQSEEGKQYQSRQLI